MPYDYFYNGEVEQYIHYTLPKSFFKKISNRETNGYENEELIGLSLNAKFLYSILLDKAKFSDKNGFTDEDGKVCVYYPQAKMAKLLHVERKQLYKYLNELDVKNGIGLIERRQNLGKGKTDCIYVKNFAKPIVEGVTSIQTSNTKYKYFCDDDSASSARFSYYPLPKALFYDVDYAEKHPYPNEVLELQNLPSNAKMAYTYFLELLPLSISKGKKDEYGRYYVICSEKDLQKLLGCCQKTVRQTLNQLDIKGGVGLIERNTDNPAIIYVLDYSARLSFSGNSNDKKNTHQNEKNTHQKKKSTHQQEEKSTHQNEKSTHQNEKSTHQNEKSTHPIYNNNPYFNNPDFNQSINQQSKSNQNQATSEKIDGLIDNSRKTLSFCEVLQATGSEYANPYDEIPEEKYFENYDEVDRRTQECKIPYTLATDKNGMKQALKFLFAYSYRVKEMEKPEITFFDSVIKVLTELTTQEKTKISGRYVKYYEIINILNDIIHNSSLFDWYDNSNSNGCFKNHWEDVLSNKAEKNEPIPHPYAFLKSCIANHLLDYGVCGTIDEMAANGFIRKNKSNSDGFNASEYEFCINNFPETSTDTVSETSASTLQTEENQVTCQPDEENNSVLSVNNSSENISPVQNPKRQEELQKEISEYMERLRKETDSLKQGSSEQEEKTKIKNALFFKEMFEEQGKPLPKWIDEALAVN